MSSYTTIKAEVIRETPRAVLIKTENDDEVWVPRSVCQDGDVIEVGDTDLCVADWFVEKECL